MYKARYSTFKEKWRGSIINLSSIYGLMGGADVPPYHASKGAVRLMSKTDALLYAADRIRVNSIHPGYIWTPLVENHLKTLGGNIETSKQSVGKLHPLGHMGAHNQRNKFTLDLQLDKFGQCYNLSIIFIFLFLTHGCSKNLSLLAPQSST